ncbi:hypothetical protein K402DRAFT_41448 [Aulographum hederae CBS 113979]|uniref:Peptidase S8/S53 domain-containing protein n=1 Tax=Aulographum hederae CBS 113979 TaxID=1176131 RepID=A0A6G1H4H7_9PEZI|nr:hypothetical protein K402DRAFT_41448 [Aulographum hederae CBS 113979]
MFDSPQDMFNDIVSKLDSAIPEHARRRATSRWELPGAGNLRGYSGWMSAPAAWKLRRKNTGSILGISFEPRLVLVPPPPPTSLASSKTAGEAGHNSSNSGPSRLARRQTTKQALASQPNDEGGHSMWHLQYLSTPPKFVGTRYCAFPGYVHEVSGGYDSDVYVMDTGVMTGNRNEFSDRITRSFEAKGTILGQGDVHGHGTMMAGAIGGYRVGVSKDTTLVPVKFIDGSRFQTPTGFEIPAHAIFQALQWILADVIDRRAYRSTVINYSWGVNYRTWINPRDYDTAEEWQLSDPWFHMLPRLAKNAINVKSGPSRYKHRRILSRPVRSKESGGRAHVDRRWRFDQRGPRVE